MEKEIATEIRMRLVEVGGKTSQDLGMGRIVGQILMYLYLREGECSLDQIGEDLGLSKAAVSTAVRHLESLGLLRQVWRKGDRKNYYRTADDIGTALQNGLLAFVRQKIQSVAMEIDAANESLEKEINNPGASTDIHFVHSRVKRAKYLRDMAANLLNSPLLGFLKKV